MYEHCVYRQSYKATWEGECTLSSIVISLREMDREMAASSESQT
jgi:hypothetical protein